MNGCKAYTNDNIIYIDDNWIENNEKLWVFFGKLEEVNLTIKLAKIHLVVYK